VYDEPQNGQSRCIAFGVAPHPLPQEKQRIRNSEMRRRLIFGERLIMAPS
jgi:hypothetical protein